MVAIQFYTTRGGDVFRHVVAIQFYTTRGGEVFRHVVAIQSISDSDTVTVSWWRYCFQSNFQTRDGDTVRYNNYPPPPNGTNCVGLGMDPPLQCNNATELRI